jgi:hypothetical protein
LRNYQLCVIIISIFRSQTRLPGAMPQSLFLLLIVLSFIIFVEVVLRLKKKLGRLPILKLLSFLLLIVFS